MSNGGIVGVEVFECHLQDKVSNQRGQLAKILNLNIFYFHKDVLTVHRAYNIGKGKIYKWQGFKIVNSIARLQFEDTPLAANSIQFFMPSISVSRNSSKDKEKLKDSFSPSNEIKEGVLDETYEHNEEGCVGKFIKFGNYLRHICSRIHTLLPERQCVKDTGVLMYKAKLKQLKIRTYVLKHLKFSVQNQLTMILISFRLYHKDGLCHLNISMQSCRKASNIFNRQI